MTYTVSSGTLNLTQLNDLAIIAVFRPHWKYWWWCWTDSRHNHSTNIFVLCNTHHRWLQYCCVSFTGLLCIAVFCW